MTDTPPPAGCTHAICLPLNGDGCQLDGTPPNPDTTAAILARPWTAVPNDEIGGWAVTTDGRTPAAGGVMAADMMWSREIAEHIAAVHNASLTAVGRCGDWCPTVTHAPRQACVLPAGHTGWHRGDGGPFGEAFAPEWGPGPLSAPTTAEHAVPAPEPTPKPAQANTAGRNNTEEQP